ncbi:MAG TPA: hypothetical protein VGE00_03245 [Gammaproteobacteria bacterium]
MDILKIMAMVFAVGLSMSAFAASEVVQAGATEPAEISTDTLTSSDCYQPAIE